MEGFEGVGECVMRRNVDKEESVEMRARQACFVQLLVDYNLYVVNTWNQKQDFYTHKSWQENQYDKGQIDFICVSMDELEDAQCHVFNTKHFGLGNSDHFPLSAWIQWKNGTDLRVAPRVFERFLKRWRPTPEAYDNFGEKCMQMMNSELGGRAFEEADQALCMGDLSEAMVKIAREVEHTSMNSRRKEATKSTVEYTEAKENFADQQ